ncbi:asparagine synthase (glutamine-hydrolyzing) [Flavobacterium sp.]|uniref:asparagine synthase (glutamine-hydrolyzing) n=1 Tax=Flavobacterium sp. TaxID=239 RepID=UPI0040488643
MCGITGFVDFSNNIKYNQEVVITEMINTLNHRGPDDKGSEVFFLDEGVIALAQARLSIIDLSSAGHQPMNYKKLSIVFNGEIYNYKELKKELLNLSHQFHTDSDTEVILHAYEEWGLKAVDRFIGMFAIVLFDKVENKIFIIRDRAGIKPLYYYNIANIFLFSSELKSFHKHPEFKKEIDQSSMVQYFQNVHHGYIAAPKTIFKNSFKLLPGHILTLDLSTTKISINKYWDATDCYKLSKLSVSYEEAKSQTKELLVSACEYRMIADVPVGVFLSGGYDSTLVTSILQNNRSEKLKTFTIGFEEGNNEAPYAKETANYLGTNHTEYICTSKEAQEIIPTLPYFYDEPFADSSAIPTMLVSKLASKSVSVVLSADAGDEVFAGYDSYVLLLQNLSRLNKVPNWFKPMFSVLGSSIALGIPSSIGQGQVKHKLMAAMNAINSNNLLQTKTLYENMNQLPYSFTDKIFAQKSVLEINGTEVFGYSEPLDIALSADYQMYLQNDILTKVDRATMSVSIEGREPLVDHRVLEFAAQLPLEYKWDGITGKKILKDIVHDYVPKSMMDRPKTGFSLPIYNWLRGDLSYLIDEYLSPEALSQSGLFDVFWVTEQVNLFKSNKLHYQPFIWKLLMFQMWYDKWMK